MDAGRLDRRITIQTFTESNNTFREPIKTWVTLATVWAQLVPQRGTERYAIREGQAVDARALVIWRIRHRTDVTTLMRISYGGELYDIQDIREIGRREGLELATSAHVA